jgi:hypothetical protein
VIALDRAGLLVVAAHGSGTRFGLPSSMSFEMSA